VVAPYECREVVSVYDVSVIKDIEKRKKSAGRWMQFDLENMTGSVSQGGTLKRRKRRK